MITTSLSAIESNAGLPSIPEASRSITVSAGSCSGVAADLTGER